MYKIALVEDEKNLAHLIMKYLKSEGYEATWFYTGEDASLQVNENFDLWILDIMLPGVVNGYDLIKKIKEASPIMPIIFTSARDQDIDKIMGLELGSDDYLAKPYSIRELMLRIKNLLNRTYRNDLGMKDIKNLKLIGEYTIDKDRRSVYLDNQAISLTSKEYDLLVYLVENAGKAFSREQILDAVWGNDYFGSDRVVDDLMRRLRQKMPQLSVETIYGYGYRLIA